MATRRSPSCAASWRRSRRVRRAGCSISAASSACIRRWPGCTRCMRRASSCRCMPWPGRCARAAISRRRTSWRSGADQRLTSGWLNRAVQGMPPMPASAAPLSVGVALPLLLRGPAPVGSYAPHSFMQPPPDLYARLVALHAHDPVTGPAIREGLQERGFTGGQLGAEQAGPSRFAFATLAGAAGRLLAAAGRAADRRDGDRRLGHACGAGAAAAVPAQAARCRAGGAAGRAWARPGARRRCWS